jgi:hypothetical protein
MAAVTRSAEMAAVLSSAEMAAVTRSAEMAAVTRSAEMAAVTKSAEMAAALRLQKNKQKSVTKKGQCCRKSSNQVFKQSPGLRDVVSSTKKKQ